MSYSERSIPNLLHDIAVNLQEILRSEVRLAKTELGDEVAKAKSAGLLLGMGALSGVFVAFFLLLGAFVALSRIIPGWSAALVVASGLAVIGSVLFHFGSKRLRTVKAMPQTVSSIEEDIRWTGPQSR